VPVATAAERPGGAHVCRAAQRPRHSRQPRLRGAAGARDVAEPDQLPAFSGQREGSGAVELSAVSAGVSVSVLDRHGLALGLQLYRGSSPLHAATRLGVRPEGDGRSGRAAAGRPQRAGRHDRAGRPPRPGPRPALLPAPRGSRNSVCSWTPPAAACWRAASRATAGRRRSCRSRCRRSSTG
jgi:hypothetical protein